MNKSIFRDLRGGLGVIVNTVVFRKVSYVGYRIIRAG